MDWIRANTPREALFLVNGALIYDGSSVVGTDAGWWIPLLARRANTMPPQYALLAEREKEAGYNQRMVDLVGVLSETSLPTETGLRMVCAEGVSHVYVGQWEGREIYPRPEPLFTAEQMLDDPRFEVRYHHGSVWVFRLTAESCAPYVLSRTDGLNEQACWDAPAPPGHA
jgi:hypothetical protein